MNFIPGKTEFMDLLNLPETGPFCSGLIYLFVYIFIDFPKKHCISMSIRHAHGIEYIDYNK